MIPADGALKKYALGIRLELHSADRAVGIEEGPDVVLTITRHLRVAHERRSQVVMATLEQGDKFAGDGIALPSPGTPVVAKIFDIDLIYFEADEWTGSRIEYIHYLKSNEVTAYKKLHSIYGTGVPTFFGEYNFGEAFVVLLEFFPQCSLVDYSVSSDEEAEALKHAGGSLIENLHSNGVYHRDIEPWNLFWDMSSGLLKVIDFEIARFKERASEALIRQWEAEDRGEMTRILVNCGVPDERPLPEFMLKGTVRS